MDSTKATVSALRAIGALSLQRLSHPAIVMTSILILAGYTLMILLTIVFSPWWLLLLIILLPVTLVALAVYTLIRSGVNRLMPKKVNKDDKQQLKLFVDRLVDVADRSRTPYPIMLFLIAKDVLRGKESAFLSSLIGDSRDLYKEFGDIKTLFRDQETKKKG